MVAQIRGSPTRNKPDCFNVRPTGQTCLTTLLLSSSSMDRQQLRGRRGRGGDEEGGRRREYWRSVVELTISTHLTACTLQHLGVHHCLLNILEDTYLAGDGHWELLVQQSHCERENTTQDTVDSLPLIRPPIGSVLIRGVSSFQGWIPSYSLTHRCHQVPLLLKECTIMPYADKTKCLDKQTKRR